MDQTKKTMLDWVKAMQMEICHINGIYYLGVENLPDDICNKTSRSEIFYYVLATKGTAEVMVDYCRKVIKKGDMLFLAPRMTMELKTRSKDFVSLTICFEPFFFDSLFMSGYAYKLLHVNKYTSPVVSISDDDFVNVKKTIELFASYLRDLHPPEMIEYLANFFLLQIAEIQYKESTAHLKQISRSDELYRSFQRLLAENYWKEHNISFYADKLHVSQPYLSRTIRKVSGNTVKFYITKTLLLESRRLLVFKDSSIKEIAETLGFADQSSFGKFFKKEMGMSPFDFRQRKNESDA